MLADDDTFIQYKAILSRVDDTTIPSLEEVSVTYTPGLSSMPDDVYYLSNPYPNPSTGYVSYTFQLPLPASTRFTVFDLAGRIIATPMDQMSGAGFDGIILEDLDPGIYLVRIESGPWVETSRFVVIEQ